MPYRLEYDSGNRILRCVGLECVTDAEMRAAHDELHRYAAACSPAVIVMDAAGISKFDVSFDTMRTLASTGDARDGIARFIVAPGTFMYGMARFFQMNAEPLLPNVRVVRSLEDVHRELGVRDVHYLPVPAVSVGKCG
jgi:hypothetical protein